MKWISLALAIAVVDQVTKDFATTYLAYGDPLAVISGVNLTLLHNTGAAFSFLHEQNGWQRWFFSILTVAVSLGLIVWLKRLPTREVTSHVAICLILGGAFGNLIDRVLLGYVVDFIQLYFSTWYWPVFNLADASITIGAILLIFKGPSFDKVD
jgi:signal peptidase II